MKIIDTIKRIFKKAPKAVVSEAERVGVWAFFELDHHFHTLVTCEDVTQGPPTTPAILIIDKTKEEARELVGKSINWKTFRYEWRRQLEQGVGFQRFRWDELKDWIQ